MARPREAVYQPGPDPDITERQARLVVTGECPVGPDGSEFRIGHHSARTAAVLFGRLEHQHAAACLRALARQQAGEGEQHCHMPVMAAKMRFPENFGRPFGAGRLLDGKGVKLGPKQHRGAVPATVVDGGDAVPAKAG